MQNSIFYTILFFIMISCGQTKEMSDNGNKTAQDPDNMIMTGQIIEKEFIKKSGESAGFTELYFRASIQDYFIKFCESDISKKELEPFIDQTVSVRAKTLEGNWDICPDDPQEMQSRVGYYMTIQQIQ